MGDIYTEYANVIYKAGYCAPTPLQFRILPEIAKGTDLFLLTEELDGKTACSFLSSFYPGNTTGYTLIAVDALHTVEKTEAHFNRFNRDLKYPLNFVPITRETELARLQNVAGLTHTLYCIPIDLLLFGLSEEAISYSEAQRIFIILDNKNAESKNSTMTLLNHCSKKTQKIIFSCFPFGPVKTSSSPCGFKSITEKDCRNQTHRGFKYRTHPDYQIDSLLWLLNNPRWGLRSLVLTLKPAYIREQTNIANISTINPDVLYDLARTKKYKNIIFLDLPNDNELLKQIGAFINYNTRSYIHIFYGVHNEPLVKRLQEFSMNDLRDRSAPYDHSKTQLAFEDLMREFKSIKSDKSIQNLRRIIRKRIPFFKRPLFNAFLLNSYINQNPSLKTAHGNDWKESVDKNKATLFISIGRNKQIFPRDIADLINRTTGIEYSSIDQIKIFDAYSFADIPKDSIEKAIIQLNGITYKNTRINVNHSKVTV